MIKLKHQKLYVKLFDKNFFCSLFKTSIDSQIPHAIIDRELKFSRNGLYLVAENKSDSFKLQLSPFNFLCLCSLAYMIFPYYVFIFVSSCLSLIVTFKKKIADVSKIFLFKDLKKVIFYLNDSSFEIYDIKNFRPLNVEDYKNVNDYEYIPIDYVKNKNIKFIPHYMTIYDKEIFCAIFRGYPIKIELEGEVNKSKYVKLKINNYE